MTGIRDIARATGPRDRLALLRAIGSGRVLRQRGANGTAVDWRYIGGTRPGADNVGGFRQHKHRVQGGILAQLIGEGLIELRDDCTYTLTAAGRSLLDGAP